MSKTQTITLSEMGKCWFKCHEQIFIGYRMGEEPFICPEQDTPESAKKSAAKSGAYKIEEHTQESLLFGVALFSEKWPMHLNLITIKEGESA